MPERLLEFNRLELTRQLESPKETKTLVEQVRQIVKRKFPER